MTVLQIASCSMHHSGALLLEARDGEFLDEQLCCSTSAPAKDGQQPQEVSNHNASAAADGLSKVQAGQPDEADGFGFGCDDGGDGADWDGGDDGDDCMLDVPDDLHQAGATGQLQSCLHASQRCTKKSNKVSCNLPSYCIKLHKS